MPTLSELKLKIGDVVRPASWGVSKFALRLKDSGNLEWVHCSKLVTHAEVTLSFGSLQANDWEIVPTIKLVDARENDIILLNESLNVILNGKRIPISNIYDINPVAKEEYLLLSGPSKFITPAQEMMTLVTKSHLAGTVIETRLVKNRDKVATVIASLALSSEGLYMPAGEGKVSKGVYVINSREVPIE